MSAREETQLRPQNIRVPVNKGNEGGFFSSIFGSKAVRVIYFYLDFYLKSGILFIFHDFFQYPVLGEIKNPIKYGFLLKRSNWLKVWEKRWFVLTDRGNLLYFETNNQVCFFSRKSNININFFFKIFRPPKLQEKLKLKVVKWLLRQSLQEDLTRLEFYIDLEKSFTCKP
jgi:hypothetical protein